MHESGVRPRLVTPTFLCVIGATLAYFTAVGGLIPVLPRFVEGPLGGGRLAIGVTVGAFSLAAVAVRPWAGRLGDRHGRRLLMVGGAGVVALTTAAFALAGSLPVVLALRVAGGFGEAMFFVGAASVVNDLAPDSRRGEAVSYFSLGLYGGIAVGPLAGETILNRLGYDTTWLAAALVLVVSAILGVTIRETRPEHEVAVSRRRRLLHGAGVGPGLVLLASVWGLAGFNAFVPLYVFDLGLRRAAPIFVLYSGIVLLIRSVGARIPDHFGTHRTARVALVLSTTGLAMLGAWAAPAGLYTGTALFALGQSLAFPALMTMAVHDAPVSERAAVVGTFTMFFDLAFGVGAVSAGAVAATLGIRGAFVVSACVTVAGLALLSVRARAERAGDDHIEPVILPEDR